MKNFRFAVPQTPAASGGADQCALAPKSTLQKLRTTRSLPAVLLSLLAITSTAKADWSLVTGDFTEQKNLTVNTWDIAEGLSLTDSTGKLTKADSRNVLSLTSDRPKPASPGNGAAWKMSLRNGDVLYGDPGKVSGQSLEFKTIDAGTVAVPLKLVVSIAGVKKTENAPADSAGGPVTVVAAPADKDVVRLKNGDMLEGLIVNVDAEKLQIAVGATDSNTTDVDMARVDRLSFGGITAPRTLPPLTARITFNAGTVLTVPLDKQTKSFAWTINDITFKDLAGQDRKISANSVYAIDVTGGRVVCLTELDPAKDQQVTFMGTQWPTQVNKNVLGQPLKVARQTFPRGLGVHTQSTLVYELDGSFDTFKFRVGMDDSAAPQGSADVAVLLDGKEIWQAKNLKAIPVDPATKAPQLSPEIELKIKGGKQLQLLATPTLGNGKLDVLGRVDWLNLALTRP